MLSLPRLARKPAAWIAMAFAAVTLSACAPMPVGTGTAPALQPGASVPVALLVPAGSGQATDDLIAQSLENAARLAIADLGGNRIDLRVYRTGGQPGQAQAQAIKAVDEGAQIILGPVFAQEANAAGNAVASRGINVLSFSNNAEVAGGNVFILGTTFQNTADRLASYAVRSGRSRMMVVHDQNPAGNVGRAAIERGVARAGGSVVVTTGYEFSQNGIIAAAPGIARQAKETGAQALFLTADTAGALPLLTQMLRDNGVDPTTTRFIGLTRWDIPAATLALPGVQGGWFAMPDPGLNQQFQARYQAAYGSSPHPLAGLAYDGIAAIGALVGRGRSDALTAQALTQGSGFRGVNGIFRLRGDGTSERGLAVAQIQNNQVTVIDPAPRAFGGAGF